jgi:hypothetical protein
LRADTAARRKNGDKNMKNWINRGALWFAIKRLLLLIVIAVGFLSGLQALSTQQTQPLPTTIIKQTYQLPGYVIALPADEAGDTGVIEQSATLHFVAVRFEHKTGAIWAVIPEHCPTPQPEEMVVVEFHALNAEWTLLDQKAEPQHQAQVPAIRCPEPERDPYERP